MMCVCVCILLQVVVVVVVVVLFLLLLLLILPSSFSSPFPVTLVVLILFTFVGLLKAHGPSPSFPEIDCHSKLVLFPSFGGFFFFPRAAEGKDIFGFV